MVNHRLKLFLFLLSIIILETSLLGTTMNNYYWDEVVYMHLAKNINSGLGYTSEIGETFRPPLLPYLLSFTTNQLAYHIFAIILIIITLMVFYKFVSDIYSKKEGLLASILLGTLPLYLFWSSKILTESLSILLTISSLFLFYKYTQSKNNNYLYASSIIASLAFMARPTNIVLPFSFIIYFLTKDKFSALKKKQYYLSGLIFLIILTPWFYLNLKLFNHPIGMLLIQKGLTVFPRDFLFYFENIFMNLTFILFLVIYGLFYLKNNWKKISIIYIYISIYLILIIGLLAHNTQNRFFLLAIPLLIIIGIEGYKVLTDQFKKYRKFIHLILIILILINLVTAFISIKNDPSNTKILIEATKEMKSFPGDKIICNSIPYCYLYSEKIPIQFPDTFLEYQKIIQKEKIQYILIDNFHGAPVYKDNITQDARLLFNIQKGYKYAEIYRINGKEDQ